MTVAEWVKLEHLLYDGLPSLCLLFGVLLFVTFFVFLYVNKLRYTLICLGLLLINACVIFAVFQGNKENFKQISLVSPAIRDRKKNFFYYEYYRSFEKHEAVQEDKAKLERLSIYQQQTFSEKDQVEYLGSDQNYYFFEWNNQSYFQSKTCEAIHFSDRVKKTELQFVVFYLKDPRFTEIGFNDEIGIFQVELLIPVEEKEKIYDKNQSDNTEKFFTFG